MELLEAEILEHKSGLENYEPDPLIFRFDLGS